MTDTVRIIDIGSNSIKVLVAKLQSGQLVPVAEGIREARISAGISADRPALTDAAMDSGLAAVCSLLEETDCHNPRETRIVATSAVRDATNGMEFRRRVCSQTGYTLDVLSGTEEASMIARGVATDPAVPEQLTILDLGGGSLECIDACGKELQTVVSFQLGAVRMMEQFHPDSARPLEAAARNRLIDHVVATFTAGAPQLRNQRTACVGCGGAFAVIRAILSQMRNAADAAEPDTIEASAITELLNELAALPLDQRLQVPGLPHSRADIFPAALAVLEGTSRYLGTRTYQHSLHNLRYGIADKILQG